MDFETYCFIPLAPTVVKLQPYCKVKRSGDWQEVIHKNKKNKNILQIPNFTSKKQCDQVLV